jgi:uncharacterized protein (TIGR02453 family)
MSGSTDAPFGPDLFGFLRELAKNNNREWFTANKARYEKSVLEPAVRFVEEMGPQLTRFSSHLVADARPFGGSISRIYRDTRFSKDKSPYKTGVGIHFSHEDASKTEDHLPGFYLHLEPAESMVASGIWRPAPPALKRIRDEIVRDSAGWAKVLRTSPPNGGESYARVPAGYDPAHPRAEDLKRKDFFASVGLKDSEVAGGRFESAFLAACTKIDPLNRFLAKATGIPW